MSKVSPLVNNFSGGEWGPLASARVDLERHKTSMETCLNYIPVLQGGLTRRPGTKYVTTAKSSAYNIQLVPFIFAKDDAYVIEVNLSAFRFYKNNAQVLLSGSAYEVSHTYTSAQIPYLKFCQSNDILYIFHPDVAPQKLIRVTDTAWSLQLLTFVDGPYLPIQRFAYTTNSAESIRHSLQNTALTGNIPIVCNGTGVSNCTNLGGRIKITTGATYHGFRNGTRVLVSGVTGCTEANGVWTIESQDDGYVVLAGSTFTNAYIAGGNIFFAPFTSADVGRFVRISDTSVWKICKIISFTSEASVTVTADSDFTSTGNKPIYSLPAYSSYLGFPSAGCFHEDRLFLFGPGQLITGSRTGDYENFSPANSAGTIVSSNALLFNLNSNDTNNAQWIVSDEKGLLAGTDANEWLIKSASTTEAISPTSINAKKVTSFGSKNISPVQAGKAVIFAQNSGRKVREFNYFYDVDGFRCTDMTQLAHHIGESGIIQMALQKQPYSLVWGVRADGTLACLTYERDVDGLKVAWHRHKLGGTQNSISAECDVLSIAVIPSTDGTHDELWLAVRRLINGVNTISIEYMTNFFDSEIEQEDAFFVDCGLTYDSPLTVTGITAANPPVVTIAAHGMSNGDKVRFDEILGMTQLNGNIYKIANKTANTFELTTFDGININASAYTAYFSGGECRKLVTTISGLTHLNGQTVQILGDGAALADAVVSAGTVTLSEASAVVQIGLGYNSDGKLPRLEAGSRDGTSLGKTRRTHRVGFMFDRSIGLKFGTSFTDMADMEFQDANNQLNQAPALFSGIKSEEFTSDSDFENQICFRQSRPYPSTILAVMPQMVTEDR